MEEEEETGLIAPQGVTSLLQDDEGKGRQRFRDYLDDDEVAEWEAGLGVAADGDGDSAGAVERE